MMKPEILKYAKLEVPRYTSYPTAVQFHDGITAQEHEKWLGSLPDNEPLSLYVHIPFCDQMCWYCGCHTNITNEYERIETYVRDLLKEIELITGLVNQDAHLVQHLHFGGGSPSMLRDKDFTRIIENLKHGFRFAENAEIAVEVDPRTMSASKAEAYAKAGVNRVSLGVQDFNKHVQQKINRIQPVELVRNVVEWLRNAGIRAINFDLIYGLPAQGAAEIKHSLEAALEMQPDRFAVFGYAHVPWFKKHQQMIEEDILPGTVERLEQADLVADILVSSGYTRIGFDHYAIASDPLAKAAQNGVVRRNFQGYTDDHCDTLIGFGASSISSLPQGYVQNSPNMGQWRKMVRDGQLPVMRGLQLSDDDRFRGEAIMAVLSGQPFDLSAHCAKWGRDVSELDEARTRLSSLRVDGLCEMKQDILRVLPEGVRFSRNIAACFDAHWQPEKKRHSVAV